jgi:LPS sulfotransferase NodH
MKKLLIPKIFPNVHSENIENFFESVEVLNNPISLETDFSVKLPDTYYICFTNRSGSNYLANLIASDGRMNLAGENTNFDTVIEWSKRNNFKSFKEYYYWLSESHKGSLNKFGCKVGAGQLVYLMNEGLLKQLELKPKFIHIVRKDVVAQAVSMLIATKTQSWTSSHDGNNVQVQFDFPLIANIASNICTENSIFNLVFRILEVDPLVIVYEDLINNPQSSLDLISDFLGVPNLRYVENKIKLQKQADGLNKAFIEKFKSNFYNNF